ncbi:MMPL family transporter [Intrasporangium mesophilum]
MFQGLGRLVTRGRHVIVVVTLLVAVGAGAWGTGVFGSLTNSGFDDPNSESGRAATLLESRIARTSPDLVVLVSNPGRTVQDTAYRSTVDAALAALPAKDVVASHTYWNTGSQSFVAGDGHTTYAAVTLTGVEALTGEAASVAKLRSTLGDAGYDVKLGGSAAANLEISDQVSSDIGRAESMSMPILLLLLVVIFGSVVAASLPLMVGGLAIVGSFAAIRAVTSFTDVSIFAINLVTILGLGLAIDYGLLVVGRFREELAAGYDRFEATKRTVSTAGRTVAVSALTVAVALSGLLLFPLTFLRSMGIGGIAAVLIAAVAAVVVLPAVLAMLGSRVDRWSLRRSRPVERGSGFWSRLAELVMRRPVAFLTAGLAILAFLAVPFLGVKFGGVDERVLPADAETRQVSQVMQRDFGVTVTDPIVVAATVDSPVTSAEGHAALARYLSDVKAVDGVTGAQVVGASGNLAQVAVTYRGEPLDDQAKNVVTTIRGMQVEGVQTLVAGPTAQLIDRLASIGDTLPLMALVIAGATFVLLFLAFGSVLMPIKAILLNLVTLAATLGVVTWVFQEGHLSSWLGFESTGFVEATQPILVMTLVFGLSMDYEVFLLSRIREQYDRTGDNRAAVATGMQRTGRIITSAALLILVVIGAFSASSITFIKLIGIAMITAIVLDALLVRMVVVPATMRLLGDANWWLPRPLARLYGRFGIREDGGSSPEPSADGSGSAGASTPDGSGSAPGTRVRPVPAS